MMDDYGENMTCIPRQVFLQTGEQEPLSSHKMSRGGLCNLRDATEHLQHDYVEHVGCADACKRGTLPRVPL